MAEDESRPIEQKGSPPETGDTLEPGTVVGDYLLGDLIAKGGCGAVYHATHRAIDQRAALKVLHGMLAAQPKIVGRFFREVELINLLRHPNIVEVHAWGSLLDGRPYYVMEHLPGGTLDHLLRDRGRLRPEETYEVLAPVCAALEAAHEAGIVHRDVKASNIAFTDAPRTAKLLDFGIAKLVSPDWAADPWLTTAGRRLGTPNIMAPEQLLTGSIDARTDVYALGVLLYRLLTGRPPFEERSMAGLVRQHLEEPAPRPSRVVAVSPALDAVVLRCLEKRPERRFDSVKAFIAALGDALGPDARGGADWALALSVPGIAVYVDMRLEVNEDLDDPLVADLGALLDLVETRLSRAGYALAQTTGTGVLGVRALSHDPEGFAAARGSALAVALALHDEIRERPGADARLHANVAVHAGEVRVRASEPPEILGGALVHTATWAPRGMAYGVCATAAAVEGVPDLDAMLRAGLVLLDADTEHG